MRPRLVLVVVFLRVAFFFEDFLRAPAPIAFFFAFVVDFLLAAVLFDFVCLTFALLFLDGMAAVYHQEGGKLPPTIFNTNAVTD